MKGGNLDREEDVAIKSVIGWLLRLAPVWSIGVNALIARMVAKEVATGRKRTTSIGLLLAFCTTMFVLLACYLLM